MSTSSRARPTRSASRTGSPPTWRSIRSPPTGRSGVNPAPFSAYSWLGDAAVLSSSPERFLRVGRDRWVEAKPIKGTVRRGHTPAEDEALSEGCGRARRTAPRT